MPKETNLVNIEQILTLAKQYEEKEIATIGGNFDIQFYPLFKQEKIDNLVQELGAFLNSNDKDSQSFIELINSGEEHYIRLIYFFVAKEFTHIGEDMKDKKTPAELFPYFEALITTGYLTELVENVFLPEELQKVLKRIAEIGSLNAHINQLGEEFYNALSTHKDKIKRVQKFNDIKKKK